MDSKKIGITGHNGFLGYHLKNGIKYHFPNYEIVDFKRDFFQKPALMSAFINSCDVIIHLAGLNRHNSSEEIARTNNQLAKTLAKSLIKNNYKGSLIYSSSLQEYKETPYGSSKKQAGDILTKAASTSGFSYTTLILPNIFGPFGKPNYNSVVATFCYKLANNEVPVVHKDSLISLIYVGELVDAICKVINKGEGIEKLVIKPTSQIKVSALLNILNSFKSEYQDNGEIPEINSVFQLNLFNTFRCYMDIKNYFPKKIKQHEDSRGSFFELIRLGIGGQVSFSTTVPGITRGNHFHTRKIERFAVIKGKALIQLRRIGTNEVLDFYLDGKEPAYVDIPIWYTHNIKNIGNDILYTNFWINEVYNSDNADTFFEEV